MKTRTTAAMTAGEQWHNTSWYQPKMRQKNQTYKTHMQVLCLCLSWKLEITALDWPCTIMCRYIYHKKCFLLGDLSHLISNLSQYLITVSFCVNVVSSVDLLTPNRSPQITFRNSSDGKGDLMQKRSSFFFSRQNAELFTGATSPQVAEQKIGSIRSGWSTLGVKHLNVSGTQTRPFMSSFIRKWQCFISSLGLHSSVRPAVMAL